MSTDATPLDATPFARFCRVSAGWIERSAVRLQEMIEARPRQFRILTAALLVIAVIIFTRRVASSQYHMLQNPIDDAYSISAALFANSFNIANTIFVSLAFLTVIISVVASYIRNQSFQAVGQLVLTQVLRLGIPFLIIQAAILFVPTISITGLQIAGNLGGAPAVAGYASAVPPSVGELQGDVESTFASVWAVGTPLNPESIVQFGTDMGWTMMQKTFEATIGTHQSTTATQQTANGYDPQGQSIETVFLSFSLAMCIGVIGAFVFIAVELVLAFVQVYLALPLGAWMLGFLGSPATRSFGAGYWNMVVYSLLRFVIVIFIIGFGMAIANQWQTEVIATMNSLQPLQLQNPNQINLNDLQNSQNVKAFKTIISTAFMSFSLLYIIRSLPQMLLGVVTGASFSAAGNSEAEGRLNEGAGMAINRGLGYGAGGFGRTTGRSYTLPTSPAPPQ